MDRETSLTYYTRSGLMTDPCEQEDLLASLPDHTEALCQVVQGCMLHIFWAGRYGVQLSEERKQEVQIRSLRRKLACLRLMDGQPLVEARPPEKRLVGNCRDFTLLLVALFHHLGVPARARCGFGAYFMPNHFEDHWVCEYWDHRQGRWLLVDSQLDALQRQALEVSFDVLDVPRDQFITGGKAWQMCRSGQADPNQFGIFEWKGMGFVRGNLLRDFLALNKIEILPWDMWGLFVKPDDELTVEDTAFLDHLADLAQAGNEAFSEIRSVFEANIGLHLPAEFEL